MTRDNHQTAIQPVDSKRDSPATRGLDGERTKAKKKWWRRPLYISLVLTGVAIVGLITLPFVWDATRTSYVPTYSDGEIKELVLSHYRSQAPLDSIPVFDGHEAAIERVGGRIVGDAPPFIRLGRLLRYGVAIDWPPGFSCYDRMMLLTEGNPEFEIEWQPILHEGRVLKESSWHVRITGGQMPIWETHRFAGQTSWEGRQRIPFRSPIYLDEVWVHDFDGRVFEANCGGPLEQPEAFRRGTGTTQ